MDVRVAATVAMLALGASSTETRAQGDSSSSSSAQPRAAKPAPRAKAVPEREADREAAALAKRLPLDPAIGDLRDTLPPDIPEAMRQLGLRPTEGARTDLRGRPLTTEEIVDALAH